MESHSPILWVIRGGRNGEYHDLFLNQNRIALGYNGSGDVSKLEPTRDAFKDYLAEKFPYWKPGAIPNQAGQLFRFVHEMKPGDYVVYPAKIDSQMHIGQVTGDYYYDSDADDPRHRRPVKWLKAVPRTSFSQGALYEAGAIMSIFQIKNYTDEFLKAISVASPRTPDDRVEADEDDETIGLVAEEIEQTTRDFVLKQLSKELKGHPFAQFVGHLMEKMGYHTRISPPGPDGGIDIVAHKDELGFEPPIIKVQVKSTSGSVGDPETSALFGKVAHGEFGLLVTLGTFTRQAIGFAETKANLRLINGEELVSLVLDYYDDLDSKYKGLLPLKRVFVPQAIDEDPVS